jgi:hypothetical protein
MAFNTCVSKCGMVAKRSLCVIKMLVSWNSGRRLAIISALHCSVEDVASAADF